MGLGKALFLQGRVEGGEDGGLEGLLFGENGIDVFLLATQEWKNEAMLERERIIHVRSSVLD